MAYNGLTGTHGVPSYTYLNDLGQKVEQSGTIYKYNKSTGQLQAATPVSTSKGGLTGYYAFNSGSTTPTSSLSAILGTTSSSNAATPAKTSAETAYEKAIKTLSGGVDVAQEAYNNTKEHIKSADSDLATARKSAANITNSIDNVNSTAQSLSGYADILRTLGLDTTGIGTAILNNDTTSGGLASEYLNAIGLAGDAALKVTPDRYVSQAAADVQSSFDNAQGQAERNLSRQGVSASSGAYGALQKQFATSLATALAAAKTKARQTGLGEQITALNNRAALMKDALTTGAALQQQGASNIESAAGIVQKQADLFATAGNLSQAQANAFANIGGVEVSLGNLETTSSKAVQDAMNNVASMQSEMAKYYANLELAKLPTNTTSKTTSIDKYGNVTINRTTSSTTH